MYKVLAPSIRYDEFWSTTDDPIQAYAEEIVSDGWVGFRREQRPEHHLYPRMPWYERTTVDLEWILVGQPGLSRD